MKVFTTEKEIRNYQKIHIDNNIPMDNAITFDELKLRVLSMDGYRFADKDTRAIIMEEAIDFPEFDKLKIPVNFESFIENIKFAINFLQEAAVENISLDDMLKVYGYEAYNEHIKVLKEVRRRYVALMNKAGYICPITLTANDSFKINIKYLKILKSSKEEIAFYYNGYLNNFEFTLIRSIAKYVSFKMYYVTSRFSENMNKKLGDIFDSKIEPGKRYLFNFSTTDLESSEDYTADPVLYTQEANGLFAQIGYIQIKIDELIKEGFDPSDIVVVVQNAKTAEIILRMTNNINFNLSGGFSFKKTNTYKALEAVIDFVIDKKEENIQRWQEVVKNEPVLQEATQILEQNWFVDDRNVISVIDILENFLDNGEKDEVQKLFIKSLIQTKELASIFNKATLGNIVIRFLRRLANLSVSHTNGGCVTIMQPLEARQIDAKAYIFTEFNDDVVPSDNIKDIFLSTEVRREVGLPTYTDRINLQKYYYELIFLKAKKVFITYDNSNDRNISGIVYNFNSLHEAYSSNDLVEVVVPKSDIAIKSFKDKIEKEFNAFEKPLSASKLKIFLECKRKFYYKYILGLKTPQIVDTAFADVGNMIHLALKEVYKDENHPTIEKEIYKSFVNALYKIGGEDSYMKFQMRIWAERIREIAKIDARHFADGWRVVEVEKELQATLPNGLIITGKIDRIERKGDKYRIIDYKTGKYTLYTKKTVNGATDFQLEFYHILATQNGMNDIDGCYFYDLKNAEIVEEEYMEVKMQRIEEAIQEYCKEKHDFEENSSSRCQFCDFKELCFV